MADVVGSTAFGSLGGAAAGALIGSAIFPGVGTVLGAAIGGGVLGGIAGNRLAKDENKARERMEALPSFDPMQLEFLDQLKREKRSIDSGFSTDFQVAAGLNEKAYAGGISVAESVARTNPALGLAYMDQASNNFDLGTNKALGTIATRSSAYTQAISALIDSISQRKLDIETYKVSQDLGMAISNRKAFNENMMNFAAQIPGMDFEAMTTPKV